MKTKIKSKENKNSRPVCYCNKVSKEKIETAILHGCNSLPLIFDATTAGVGACGGSCRPYIEKMLESFAANGTFPENPRPAKPHKKNR